MSEEVRRAVVENTMSVMTKLFDFYTADEALLWMRSEQPLLDGRCAIDLIAEGNAVKVLSLIQAMDEGMFIRLEPNATSC